MYWDEPYIENEGITTDERIRHGCLSGASLVVAMIITLVICALSGCKSVKYIKVPDIRTDTLYITKQQRDSIWLHDSIFMHEYQSGDTVFMLRDRWHTKYIESIKHDTTYIATHDTIPQPYPVEVKVPRELTWWQKTLQRTGGIALIVLLVWIVRTALKIYTKCFY